MKIILLKMIKKEISRADCYIEIPISFGREAIDKLQT